MVSSSCVLNRLIDCFSKLKFFRLCELSSYCLLLQAYKVPNFATVMYFVIFRDESLVLHERDVDELKTRCDKLYYLSTIHFIDMGNLEAIEDRQCY